MSSPNLILYSKYSYLASCCLLQDLWYFAFLGLVEATRPPFLAGDHHQDLASRGCPVYCLAARVWSVKMTVVTVVILTDQTLGAKQKSRQSVGQLSCFAWPSSHGMCWRTVAWSEQWSEVCEDCKWQPNQKCECLSMFHSLRVEVMLFFCSWNFAQSFVWRCGEKFLWPSRFSPAFWGKANSFAMDGAWVWQLSTWKKCNLKHRALLPSCLCSNTEVFGRSVQPWMCAHPNHADRAGSPKLTWKCSHKVQMHGFQHVCLYLLLLARSPFAIPYRRAVLVALSVVM